MRFRLLDEKHYHLSHMDLLLAEFLKQLPFEADPGRHEGANGRLYSPPVDEELARQTPTIREDWEEYVTPELRHLFESARETVTRDLQHLQPMELDEELAAKLELENLPPLFEVQFPRAHRDAWLSALNQARLVLAEKYGWNRDDRDELEDLFEETQDDDEDSEPNPDEAPFPHRKRLALLQMHVYSLLQEFLIEDFRQESGDPPYASESDLEDEDDDEEGDDDWT